MRAPLDWLTARPIAHRGLHDKTKGVIENTASAAKAAIDAGFAIECDVQLTGDGEAVVFHDFALDRLTEAKGRVDQMSAAALGEVAMRATKDRIMRLREWLALVAGRVPAVIEIKSGFRGELALTLERVERAELGDEAAARFLPSSRRDIDELEGFFEHLARELYDPPLRALLDAILADPALRAELRRAPCSLPAAAAAGSGGRSGSHHAFLGGLIEHTVAVATLALDLCAVHPRLDRDLLLCAALVHDIGKTREYAYGAEISLSEEGRMLGHVELGLRILAAHAPASLSGERRLALEHCVLAHHGERGSGSHSTASAEALALARLNALDAGVKGAFEHGIG